MALRVENGQLQILFDPEVVSDNAAQHILRQSNLARYQTPQLDQRVATQIWQAINTTVVNLQKEASLVWDAFTRKWEIYDHSRVAHLQEGRA